MKVCKKRQIFCPSPDQKIISKYLEFHFADFNPLCFAICCNLFNKKVLKYHCIYQDNFVDTKLDLSKQQQHVFCLFHPFFSSAFFKTKFFRDSWGVNTALSKNMRIFCKRLRRNKLPKLTTFSYFFSYASSSTPHPCQ